MINFNLCKKKHLIWFINSCCSLNMPEEEAARKLNNLVIAEKINKKKLEINKLIAAEQNVSITTLTTIEKRISNKYSELYKLMERIDDGKAES